MELGYAKSEDSVAAGEWRDNWIRTFRGGTVPQFDDGEKGMLREYLEGGHIVRMQIYLTDPKFGHCLDDDMAGFVIREFMRGNL